MIKKARDIILKSRKRPIEVMGLGVIASLIPTFWSLVDDGTLQLSDYLVFVGFLLVSAGGLVWRIVKLGPSRSEDSPEPRQPHV